VIWGSKAGTLANWVNAWRRENQDSEQPMSPFERARVADMEDEIRRLRMENEFLKNPRPSSRRRRSSRALRGH
jgi:transposase